MAELAEVDCGYQIKVLAESVTVPCGCVETWSSHRRSCSTSGQSSPPATTMQRADTAELKAKIILWLAYDSQWGVVRVWT